MKLLERFKRDRIKFQLNILTLMVLVMITIINSVAMVTTFTKDNAVDVLELKGGWTDRDGAIVDLRAPVKGHRTESFFYTFEDGVKNKELVFAARNCYVDIYQDGIAKYMSESQNSRLFGKSPGTKWYSVALTDHERATTIEIHCTACYNDNRFYLSDLYVGSVEELNVKIATKLLPEFILNASWIIVGIFLIVLYIFGRSYFRLSVDFLYLSLCECVSAGWCGAEMRSWQYFFGHSEYVHLLSYLALVTLAPVIGCLAISKLSGMWKTFSQIYTASSAFSSVIICLLHITGTVEFHYTIKFVHLFLVLGIPLATKIVVNYAAAKKVRKKTFIITYTLLIGFLLLGIIRYMTGHYSDFSIFSKVALFSFLAVLIIYQMENVNEVFVRGLQSDFLKDMAMLDHLTKFFNRTGLAEHTEKYEQSQKPIGVVEFDVNELKAVNDTFGHEKGDELICLASSGISECFSRYGRCYRLGGDEFLVVITSDNPQEAYETGIMNLEIYCNAANSVPNMAYKLHIAHGFAMLMPGESLSDAVAEADAKMYEKKKEMKGLL